MKINTKDDYNKRINKTKDKKLPRHKKRKTSWPTVEIMSILYNVRKKCSPGNAKKSIKSGFWREVPK